MNNELLTLEEIWEKADGRLVEVTSPDGYFSCYLMGIIGLNAILQKHDGEIFGRLKTSEWKIHKEKKTQRMWPAIFFNPDIKEHDTSTVLFTSTEHARDYYNGSSGYRGYEFIRLATSDDFKNGFLVEAKNE